MKPKLKRDWIGRKVRLLHDLKTRGGTVFKKDTVMTVDSYRGSLNLSMPTPNKNGDWEGRCIRRVSGYDVELLP